MVFAWRWARSRLLAGYQGCRRGTDDHGRPSVGQGRNCGPRVHRSRSTFAAPLAHGQSRAPAISARLTWRTADDCRCCFRWYRFAAPRFSQPVADRAAHAAVDTIDLLAADHLGQWRSDRGRPADDLFAHRARLVARSRTHRPDAGPTANDLAGGHDSIHALVRCRLERGHQRRLPYGRL